MKQSTKLIKEFRKYKNFSYDIKNMDVMIRYLKLIHAPDGKFEKYYQYKDNLKYKLDHLDYLLSTLDRKSYLLLRFAYIEGFTYEKAIELGLQIGIDFGFMVDIGEDLEAIIFKLCQIVDTKIFTEGS